DADYERVEFLAQLIAHEACFFPLDQLPFRHLRAPLVFGRFKRNSFELYKWNWPRIDKLSSGSPRRTAAFVPAFLLHCSVYEFVIDCCARRAVLNRLSQNAMNYEVGIAPDGRCEVCVARGRKCKVAVVVRPIAGLLQ